MIKVKHTTLIDPTRESLMERVESVLEVFRNAGYRILAVMPSPLPSREREYIATVFYEVET